jgi:prepilin-type N-terminal cleavage/methylation domain-containing protein
MRRSAFTLLEVMAVVALLGLLAGAVAWSLAGAARRGARADAVGQIAHADRRARLAARRLGKPCVLRFDLKHQRVRRLDEGQGGRREEAHALRLSKGYRIDRIVIPSRSGTKTVACGLLDVAYAPGGRSISYAVRLVRVDSAEAVWLVLCGLTGQVVRHHDESEVYNLFAALAEGRPDAR